MPPALEIRNLRKAYGDLQVLQDISVAMEAGEFLVLVGPSGCGKSTLLNCIAGLEETSGGEILIAGKEVTQVPPRDRDIAMVFQSYALYPTMSVAENIGFGMKIRKLPGEELRQRTQAVAQMLQLEPLLDRLPSQLSGGQRQRVAMGRALVREPHLFLFDEPLSNLDAKLRVEMRAEIKRLHQQTGTSIVYVTHDQIEAMTLASQIVLLHEGVIQQIGPPREIYERPVNTFVADFIGSPPMNLIPGHILPEGVLQFGERLSLPLPVFSEPLQALAGKPVIAGIRPEHFLLTDPDDPQGVRLNVVMVENAGADAYITVDFGTATGIVRRSGYSSLRAEDQLSLKVAAEHLSFFHPDTSLRVALS
ncbi:MAG: ABC transporter ATP-binding protein [bacterium]